MKFLTKKRVKLCLLVVGFAASFIIAGFGTILTGVAFFDTGKMIFASIPETEIFLALPQKYCWAHVRAHNDDGTLKPKGAYLSSSEKQTVLLDYEFTEEEIQARFWIVEKQDSRLEAYVYTALIQESKMLWKTDLNDFLEIKDVSIKSQDSENNSVVLGVIPKKPVIKMIIMALSLAVLTWTFWCLCIGALKEINKKTSKETGKGEK